MRIFLCELKKLWNWRFLVLIAAMGALTFFAFSLQLIDSYNGFHGGYGNYQTEMFDRYGDTLESEELADYNLPARIAKEAEEVTALMTGDPLFEKYGIYSAADIEKMYTFEGEPDTEEYEQFRQDAQVMSSKLQGESFLDNPLIRLHELQALERHYSKQPEGGYYLHGLLYHADGEPYYESPVVRRQVEKNFQAFVTNLIRYDLAWIFSEYAAIASVFAVIAVLVLIAPLLTTDRARNIHSLQYSSNKGRKTLGIQLSAAMSSAFGLGLALTAAFYAPFFVFTDASKYLSAHIASFGTGLGMNLYNIPFGQYVLVLTGMTLALCLGAACVTFALSRFSASMVTMLIKTVPAGIALAAVSKFAVSCATSDSNVVFHIFTNVLKGSLDCPEIFTCAAILFLAVLTAAIITLRERKADC